jgi:hypothetical protein
VKEIRITERALRKLASREPPIEEWEPYEVWLNRHVIVRNKRDRAASHRLIGRTDAGRRLTILVRASQNDSSWVIVNGWDSSKGERTLYRKGVS